jgi:hypothetical protein
MFVRRTAALLVGLAGCVDPVVSIQPRTGGVPADRLSELGLFDDVIEQRPAPGVIPYDVIAPLWSDGASKLRFIAVDPSAPLSATDNRWAVSPGTYAVKTFYFPLDARDPSAGRRLLETRVIAFTSDGAAEATYVWNEQQTEAYASGGNLDLSVRWIDLDGAARNQTHHVPGTSQCEDCHRSGDAARALGLRTPELVADQAEALVAAGVVDRAPTSADRFVDPYGDAPLDQRAASYLEMNCAHCHSRGGSASGTGVDWEREHALDNVCRSTRSIDGRDRIIVPGAPEKSELLARMRSTDAFVRMPRGPSHIADERGIAMLSDWISSLPAAGCR